MTCNELFQISRGDYDNILVWTKRENMSPCTGSMVNTGYERIASYSVSQFRTRSPESNDNSATHYCAECTNHSATSSSEKQVPVIYQTSVTTASWLWTGTILHWAAYPWRWFVDIIFVSCGNIESSLAIVPLSIGIGLSIIHPYGNKNLRSSWQASIRVAPYERHGVSHHR